MMRSFCSRVITSLRGLWIDLRESMSLESVAPSRVAQCSTLFVSAALVAAGVWGGQYFMENDYVVDGVSDKTSWTNDSGYTEAEFGGLVLQTLCLPAAAIALMSFSLHFYKSPAWNPWAKVVMFVLLLLGMITCATIADVTMTDGLVDCLWSLCLDSSTTSDSFSAFIPTTGFLYFCVLIIFCAMNFLLATRSSVEAGGFTSFGFSKERLRVVGAAANKDEMRPLMADVPSEAKSYASPYAAAYQDDKRRHRQQLMDKIWMGGVFCFVFPLLIFESMAIGDSWTHFYVGGLKEYASSSVTQAYGTVWNFWLESDLILKLFPDILIYWSFVYVLAIVALIARAWDPLRRFFHTPSIFYRWRGWSNGELFLRLYFVALLVGEGCYWYFDHGWHSESKTEKTWEERFARTMGQLANLTMGLMIMPVSRNGVWQKIFGIGWESMIAYHRLMARFFLVIVMIHMVFFWVVYAQEGYFWHDWPIAIPMDYNGDNFTVPLSTLSTWVMVVLMFGCSLHWVRRHYFEVFYYAHHYAVVVWLVMLWHATSAWYYIIASVSLWALDRMIRFMRGLTVVSVSSLTSWGNVTRLSYTVEAGGIGPWGRKPTAMCHEAGQYAFVNVPAISALQWHPFTISSCPEDTETTHHIKDMGMGTFTHQLRMLATFGRSVQVNVDGPYGVPIEFHRYRLLVMFAGGIGITPCMSVMRHLNNVARAGGLTECLNIGVRLIWSTRSMDEMVMMERELQEIAGEEESTEAFSRGRFSVHLHLTGTPMSGMASPTAQTCLPYSHGRPDLRSYLSGYNSLDSGEQGRRKGPKKALVFACGPSTLVKEAREAAIDAEMEFSTETFEL